MPNDLNTNLALILNGLGAMPSGSVSLRLSTQTTAVSNAGVAETDLMTYTLPANALNSNNQSVRITAWGTFAANANTKTIKLYFGATGLVTQGGVAPNGLAWRMTAEIIRTSATAQVANAWLLEGPAFATNQTASTPAETLSGTVVIKATGTSAVGSSDVTQTGMIVEWLP